MMRITEIETTRRNQPSSVSRLPVRPDEESSGVVQKSASARGGARQGDAYPPAPAACCRGHGIGGCSSGGGGSGSLGVASVRTCSVINFQIWSDDTLAPHVGMPADRPSKIVA